jgi:hypothetical protein
MEKYRISEEEASRVLVKRVNDRPNALATYGEAKKDSTQAKDIFDRQFELVKDKHNGLIDEVEAELSAMKSDADKANEELEEKISAGLGKQGAVEIPADAWSGAVAIVSVADAGANDMITFSPATESDKTTLNNCGVFISPVVNEGIVRLSCRVKPTVAISLVYFITRGAE